MNIEVVARIRPARRSENASLNLHGSRVQVSDGSGHIFDTIYRPETSTFDVFKGSISSLVELFVSGYNVCVLVFGESSSGKSYTIAGERTSKAGLIPLLINAVFTALKEKKADRRDVRLSRNQSSHGVVSVQLYEIYNEKVRDLFLLPHEEKFVDIAEDGPFGIHVRHGTVRRVSDAPECTMLFRQGWAARNQSKTDFGMADNRSAVLFSLDLSAVHQDNSDPVSSWLSVIELPGAEKLAEDPTQLRMREGHSLNKSILAFDHLVSVLAASPRPTRIINYGESKLTLLLKEVLGGNCKTKALVTLQPSETSALGAVLRIAGQLAQIKNYPIINDLMAKDLLCQYRTVILQQQEDLKKVGRLGGGEGGARTDELKEQMTQLSQDNLQLQKNNEQLHSRLEQLQARYSELVNSKTQLSSKLIFSEEEKLGISKTLVDLQLENNRIQEEAEDGKFELTNKVLKLENEVIELQMALEKEQNNGNRTRDQIMQLKTEHKELTNEYIVLKTNHIQLTAENQREVAKNEELGLELVGLINMKDKLQKDKEAVEIEKMQEYYQQLRKIAGKFSRSSLREKDDLSRSLVSLQSEKFELEKQLLQNNHDRGGYVEILNLQHQRELTKLEDRISKLKNDLSESQRLHREAKRMLAQQSAEVITANAERKRLEDENRDLDQQSRELSAEYSNRLQQYIRDIAAFCSKSNGSHPSVSSFESHIDTMVRQIRYSHEKKEESLSARVQQNRATITNLVQRHEKLLSAYRTLRYDLGTKEERELPSLDELELPSLPSDEDLRSAQYKELAQLSSKLKESDGTIAVLKQKLASTEASFEQYKKTNESTYDAQRIEHVVPTSATIEMGWGHLRRQLREFTLNTQQELETERATLMTRCALAEEQVSQLKQYIDTKLKRYQEEIARLRKLLSTKTQGRSNNL